MSIYDLLPPNATALERDLSRVTSSLQRAAGPVPVIRTAKRVDIPDSVVPWLIYEYGLGEILPYLGNNQRRAIAEGVLWQRIRGTPEAIRIALSWIDIVGTLDESEAGTYRWAEYQLGLPAAVTSEQTVTDIVGVARISAPVRSRLQRIYAVYDHRRFVLDHSLLSDGGILSDHSGVRPRPDWPQISFGQNLSAVIDSDATVMSACTEVLGGLAELQDRFRLDHSLLDEEWHGINYPSLLTTQEGVSAVYGGQTWGPFPWPATTWLETNVVVLSGLTNINSVVSNPNRVAGLHLDGNLNNTVPGNTAVGSEISWITSGQKFGTGALTRGYGGGVWLFSSALTGFTYPNGSPATRLSFVFRFWIKVPSGVQDVELAGFGYINGGDYLGTRVDGINSNSISFSWYKSAIEDGASLSFGTVPTDSWAFIEVGCINNTIRGSVNGVVSPSSIAFNPSEWDYSAPYLVHSEGFKTTALDDFEYLVGEGPRTTNFTPPTAAFT